MTVLIALLVCLIPTTIGGLLSAIGIAGIDRMVQKNVLAMSGKAVEAAGDVHVLLLDKTGTITHGNRQAVALLPAPGVTPQQLAAGGAAVVAGRRDARRAQHRDAGREAGTAGAHSRTICPRATFVPFSAQTRMSGVDVDGQRDPQGRRGRRQGAGGRHAARRGPGRGRRDRPQRRHAAGRRRAGKRARASSTSRTSSRTGSPSASAASAPWASARS